MVLRLFFFFKQKTAYEIGLGIPAEPLFQQKESTARVASIMENTNLSKQQQVSEIMRQMLTQAQTAGQYFTNDQIKEMTRKVSAEVDLVHQQTQNQRYGSSHIGATAKEDRKSGSAGMPRPISYAVFCLKKKSRDGAHLEAHKNHND